MYRLNISIKKSAQCICADGTMARAPEKYFLLKISLLIGFIKIFKKYFLLRNYVA